jgi:hypothetical protein
MCFLIIKLFNHDEQPINNMKMEWKFWYLE